MNLKQGYQKPSLTLSLMLILLLSVVLRGITAIYLADRLEGLPGISDQISYHRLALRLLDGQSFTFGEPWWPQTAADAPTAHWSYLYTFFLAAVYSLGSATPLVPRLIQAVVVGALQPLLAFMIARRIFGNRSGLLAAGITAIYAYFIYYAASLMTEPFFILAILTSLYLAIRIVDRMSGPDGTDTGFRKLAIALGIALGAAVLLRQLFLFFVPVLLLWMWWAGGRQHTKSVLISVAVVVSFILPFTVYNYARFDRFVLLNTNAGYALFWANHPIYGTRFEPILPEEMGSYQEMIPEELRGLDEAALDQELLRRGVGFVTGDPVRYLRLSVSRIPAYFMFWPSAASSALSNIGRSLSFGLFLPFMLYGLARAWIDRGKAGLSEPVVLLYLFIGIYSAIHLLSWALIRYRLPVDAVLVIFAAVGLVDVAERIGVVRKSIAQPA